MTEMNTGSPPSASRRHRNYSVSTAERSDGAPAMWLIAKLDATKVERHMPRLNL